MAGKWSLQLAACLAVFCIFLGCCGACRPIALMQENCIEPVMNVYERNKKLGEKGTALLAGCIVALKKCSKVFMLGPISILQMTRIII